MATASTTKSERPLTIGAVCRRLGEEFPEISISKIRYLEDQGLLAPRRTRGGYRLYTESDIEQLRTVLRLQRDEFLPLRVIRDELTAPGRGKRDRRKSTTRTGIRSRLEVPLVELEELCERAGVEPGFVGELEAYDLIEPERDDTGGRRYPETDAEIAAACWRLARYGIAPRNLQKLRRAADNAVADITNVVAPALRSRNPERRQAGLDDLETLAGLSLELAQLLFWRAVRSLARP
ncbi:MAG: MerR family transcriptional regulator [Thermoleophilia bacterium]|nr:MerR family transcriptional regulator [Thermoleophilia bacterium]